MFDSVTFIKVKIKEIGRNDKESEYLAEFIKQFYGDDLVLDADEVKKLGNADRSFEHIEISIGEDTLSIGRYTNNTAVSIKNDKNGIEIHTEVASKNGAENDDIKMLMKASSDKVKQCVIYDDGEVKSYNNDTLEYMENVDIHSEFPEYIKPDAVKKLDDTMKNQPEAIISNVINSSIEMVKELTGSPKR